MPVGYLIVGTAVLFTYFLRDSQALSWNRSGFRLHASLYTIVNVLAVVCLSRAVHRASFDDVFGLARHPAVWISAVALHVGYWQLSRRFRRAGESSPAWLLSVLPSPVLILFLAAFSYLLVSGWPRWASATFIAVVWSACVGGAADWIAKDQSRSAGWDFVTVLLQGSNLFALLLVPFGSLGDLVRVMLTAD